MGSKAALTACVALTCLSCEGSLGSSNAEAGGRAAHSANAGTGTLSENNNTALDRSAECDLGAVGRSPVRRLSHVEYNRTLRDLFPDADLSDQQMAREEPIHGFENNARAMNPAAILVEQRNAAAQAVAARVVSRKTAREATLGCDPEGDEAGCSLSFIENFGKKAFRRPLTEQETSMLHDYFLEKKELIDFNGALELVLQAFLQSPHFLYRLEFGATASDEEVRPLSDWELATRLSYTLLQTTPDAQLLAVASASELSNEETYLEQVERLLEDPRAATAFSDYHRQWLELDELLEQSKDGKLFPSWNNDLRGDLLEESLRFARLIYERGSATQAELFLGTSAEVNAVVAAFYGVTGPAEGWDEAVLPEDERAGILTRGAFLATHARPTNGSPPLRGVAVLDKFLCAEPPEPPPSVDTSLPEEDEDAPMTNRQLFESRTKVTECQGCHIEIDGIGMSFEHYDAIGMFRSEDNGMPVDASGALFNTDVDTNYESALGLSAALAESEQVTACMMVNWYRYIYGRDEEPEDWCKVDEMQRAASAGEHRDVLRSVVTSYEFRHVSVGEK